MSLPGGPAFPGRHDGISSRRINLRGAATREHPDVGVRADHSNAGNLGNFERELRVLVSEQHNALFLNHGPQYPENMIIHFRHGYLAGLHSFLHGIPIKDFTRFLVIQSCGRRLRGTVRSLPVRQNKALKVPVFLQHIGQQVLVFTSEVTIHPVVGTHHGGSIGLAQANLEGQQVTFSHRPLVNVDVDSVPPALLIVEHVVLYVAKNVLRLLSAHNPANHLSRQDGIFAHIFEGTSIARLTGQIHAPAQRHVVALGS